MQTGVLSALQLTSMFPNLVRRELLPQDAELDRAGQERAAARLRHPGAARHDARRRARQHPARAAHRGRPGDARDQGQRRHVPGRLLRDQARPAVRPARQEPARAAELSRIRTCAPTTTAAGRWGWRCCVDVKEIKDKAILDVADDAGEGGGRRRARSPAAGSAGLAVAHYGSNNMIAFRYKLRNVPMKIADKSFTADGVEFPAGSFVIAPPADLAAVRAAVERARPDGGGALRGADRRDARRRRAARRDLLVVERHAGDRLVPLHVRQVRHSRST